MSTCAFGDLAAGMAVLALAPPDEAPKQCGQTGEYYVTVAQHVTGGYEVEHIAKVCPDHEHQVSGIDGHVSSRKIRIRS